MTHHCVQPGDTIQMGSVSPNPTPPIPTPTDIWGFLVQRGWKEVGEPYGEDKWTHDGKQRLAMNWEQAMAIEFYEFITIGGR